MENIAVFRPLLPVAEKLRPYLERIDAARYYSNMGPLIVELEKRLAAHFGVEPSEVVTSANGTLALTQMLRALNVKDGSVCLMPSWTFTATPAAAISAGMKPYFIDVKKDSWAIAPEDATPLLAQMEVGAVVVVAPFGAPVDTAAWEAFQMQTGVPVIIDAAAAFDTFAASLGKIKTSLPYMVSLHATKVLGIGEGAVVVTSDEALAKRVRMEGNFGFHGSRESQIPAMNAKLSEYAAAVGLAAFDEWSQKRAGWKKLTDMFCGRLQRYGLETIPGYNDGWISCYGLVQLPAHLEMEEVKAELGKRGIQAISWWGNGCHTHAAYAGCQRGPLPNTDHFGHHVIGLPFWIGLTEAQFDIIFTQLNEVIGLPAVQQKLAIA